jgi:hypothetical protein
MGIMSKAFGIQPPRVGDDTLADRALRAALAGAAIAHQHLRENLRSDPLFGPVICRALGCADPDCTAVPTLEKRAEQIPPVINKLADGAGEILP